MIKLTCKELLLKLPGQNVHENDHLILQHILLYRLISNRLLNEEKSALKAKYKQLRNKTISQIRSDTIQRNGDRITEAKSEGETWRVINEIMP